MKKTNNIKLKKNGNVSIEMSLEQYNDILKGHNNLKNALSTLSECQDLWMSDIRKMETLIWANNNGLGFISGEHYFSDAEPAKGIYYEKKN